MKNPALKLLLATMFALVGIVNLPAHTLSYNRPGSAGTTPGSNVNAGQKSDNVVCEIIPAPNKTWGYDIFIENRLFIHQTSVPGMPGNEGFKTKEGAAKVAAFVVAKIKKGEVPPTVTAEDLKKLNAL